MTRFHLVNGIMSYLASPLWLMFLATGIALSWVAEAVPPNYFPSDFALYPTWPHFDARQAFSLLGVSLLVLLAHKLLAWGVTSRMQRNVKPPAERSRSPAVWRSSFFSRRCLRR